MSERTLRLYDTMTRQVKPLELIEPGCLRFYSCGPTVYSYAHIGNFRTFLTADLVIRTAEAIGWTVKYVSNITDVGHLTQDDVADAGGEDKMASALKSKEGEQFNNVWELAEYYEDAFREDWARLNLREPFVRPRATQHMREQIVAAEQLIEQGYAYETPTGVYFSVDSFKGYGKLSGNTQENLRKAVREVVLDDNKKEQADFALWKKDDKHLMQWYSPFGWGFPGWHLECSVMARMYLGDTLDLHAGGEDLVFPHHECEIAQSEALTGKPFSNHWIHTRFLQVNGEKMSKRTGNFYTVRSLLEKGADPLAIRYALISGIYTKPLNFTDQGLSDAMGNIERFKRSDAAVAAALENGGDGPDTIGVALDELYEQALDAMTNDLNTSVALAKALEGTRVIQREAESLSKASGESGKRYLDRINALLGIVRPEREVAGPAVVTPASKVDEARIQALIDERAAAKKAKNFARADEIRKELDAEGIELRDSPEGTNWVVKTAL
ncbi:MAG: cysteine--tRNA ligase [Fimbriimonas sp.]|nr:cysteine--tRNA ligase [Fimbriimonas sp.]